MKILMVGVSEKTKGGMWTVVENYLNSEKLKSGNDIHYIATATSGNSIKRALYSIWGILKVLMYTVFNRYSILHVHMSERLSVFRKGIVMRISKIRHAKIIVHMHGAEFEMWYKEANSKKQKKIKGILNSADKIVILGEYWRTFIESLIDDKEKITVIYNAVSCPSKNLYNCSSNKLLFLGSVCERKGIYDLLEAMKIVSKKNSSIKLDIYGPDNTAEGINNLIRSNNLSKTVAYKGWLTSDNKEKILSGQIALNILPSYNEGLPMTILETMSYGIPNISTNVAAIPEVVNRENGYLIDPGNSAAIAESILNFMDGESRLIKSDKAYTVIKKSFQVRDQINATIGIYEELYR